MSIIEHDFGLEPPHGAALRQIARADALHEANIRRNRAYLERAGKRIRPSRCSRRSRPPNRQRPAPESGPVDKAEYQRLKTCVAAKAYADYGGKTGARAGARRVVRALKAIQAALASAAGSHL
jgi:beta-phosphoglucomutase-like phosphatase (HAD superfamily)